MPRFYLPLDQMFPQTNVSQFIVLPQGPDSARGAAHASCRRCWPTEFPEVRGRVKLLPNGPPVPYPVQFRVVGPDPAALRELRRRGQGRHARQPEHARRQRQLERVGQGAAPGSRPGQGARAGRDQPVDRAGGASTILSGTTVGQFREGDKLIDIVLRQPLDERNAITDIGNAYLPTASGKSIPLTQIAKPVFAWEPGVMWRENRDYAITVQARHRRRPAGRRP